MNLDVALTLKLIKDQFGSAAKDAAKDLGSIKDAADKMASGPGVKKLDETLKSTGLAAKDTAKTVTAVKEAADKLAQTGNPLKLGSGLKEVQSSAKDAAVAISVVGDKTSKVDKTMHAMGASANAARHSLIGVAATAGGIMLLGNALSKASEKLKQLANASADFEASSARRAESMGMRGRGAEVRARARDASMTAGVPTGDIESIITAHASRGGKWDDIAGQLAELGIIRNASDASPDTIGRVYQALTRRRRSTPGEALPALKSVIAQNLDGPFAADMPKALADVLDGGGFGGDDNRSVQYYGAFLRTLAESSGSTDRAKDVLKGVRKKFDDPDFRKKVKEQFGVDLAKVEKQARKQGKVPLEAAIEAVRVPMERKKWQLRGKAGQVNPVTGEMEHLGADVDGPVVDPALRQAVEDTHNSSARMHALTRLTAEGAAAEIEKSKADHDRLLAEKKKGNDASSNAAADKAGEAAAPAVSVIDDAKKAWWDAVNKGLDANPSAAKAAGTTATLLGEVPGPVWTGLGAGAGYLLLKRQMAKQIASSVATALGGAAAAGGGAAWPAIGGFGAAAGAGGLGLGIAGIVAATSEADRKALASTAGYPETFNPTKPWMTAPSGKGPIGIQPGMDVMPKYTGQVQDAAKVDLQSAGAHAMQTYAAGLESQGATAVGKAQGIVEQLKALLNTTFTPTIAPRVTAPSATPAATPAPATPGKQSRAGGVNYHGDFHFHGIDDVPGMHRQLASMQSRDARDRSSDALHDIDVGGYA